MFHSGHAIVALATLALAVGCSPVVRNHGYAPPPEELAQIQVGSDTRGSVRRKIGRPGVGGVFTSDGWYYVSTKVSHVAYYEPEVTDRTVVAVLFDQADVVASVDSYGFEDGQIINLETRTTPTQGRELTVIQQLLGSFGNINAEDVLTTGN